MRNYLFYRLKEEEKEGLTRAFFLWSQLWECTKCGGVFEGRGVQSMSKSSQPMLDLGVQGAGSEQSGVSLVLLSAFGDKGDFGSQKVLSCCPVSESPEAAWLGEPASWPLASVLQMAKLRWVEFVFFAW